MSLPFQFYELWCPPCRQPAPSAEDIVNIKILIAKLEGAIAQTMMGQNVRVLVDQNGERLEFTGASLPQMKAYLEEQRAKLPNYCPTTARPMRFFF